MKDITKKLIYQGELNANLVDTLEEKSGRITCNYSQILRNDLHMNDEEFLNLIEWGVLEECKMLIQERKIYIKNVIFNTSEKNALIKYLTI